MGLKLEGGKWILGPGGGVDLDDIKNTRIDLTDGTWTLQDNLSAIQSVSHASDVNTVVFNAIAAGAANQISSSTLYNGPRWYKLLKDNSGTQITSDDLFQMTFKIEPQNTATAPCPSCVMLGISESPTSVGSNNTKTFGLTLLRSGASSNTGFLDKFISGVHASSSIPIYGVTGGWAASSNFCQANFTKIRTSTGALLGTVTNSQGTRDQSTHTFTSSVNLYLTVAMFFRFNTDAALLNADEDWKLSYSLTKVN